MKGCRLPSPAIRGSIEQKVFALILGSAGVVTLIYGVSEYFRVAVSAPYRALQPSASLKRVGVATQLYTENYDGYFPPAKWQSALMARDLDLEQSDLRTDPYDYQGYEGSDFAMAELLPGANQATIEDPANTILHFESKELAFDQVGGFSMLRDDEARLDPPQAISIGGNHFWIWKNLRPSLKNPLGKPHFPQYGVSKQRMVIR